MGRRGGVELLDAQLGMGDLQTQNYKTDLVNKCLLGSYQRPSTILDTAGDFG